MRATLIINPIAGPGRAGALAACADLARSTLGARGYEVDVHVTASPDDAGRFAAAARTRGADLVVAWGGDGTINGAGAALAGSTVPLAIIPGGSGNGLARELGLPLEARAALMVAAGGGRRTIDAGDVDGSLFFNVAGIGLDAEIAARLAAPGARRGLAGYVHATLAELPRYRPRRYAIHVGGEVLDECALFIALANSCQYGNGAQIAPQARLDDGRLDLVVVRAQSLVRIVGQIPAFFRGTLRDGPGLVMRLAAQLEIEGDRPLGFHVDGEPRTGSKRLRVRTWPRHLIVVVTD